LLLAAVEVIHRTWRPPAEYSRKLAHVGAGGIAFFALPLLSTHWPVLLLTLIFSGALLAGRRLGWFASLGLPERRQGDLLFLWAVYLVFLLADGDQLLFQAPVLVLTIGDAAAALMGQRYGRIRYAFLGNNRTVEGSVALMVASVILVFGLLFILADLSLVQCALLSLLAASVAGAVEAISPQGWDNVGIPLATLFLLKGFLN
jgi:phytol kinase